MSRLILQGPLGRNMWKKGQPEMLHLATTSQAGGAANLNIKSPFHPRSTPVTARS